MLTILVIYMRRFIDSKTYQMSNDTIDMSPTYIYGCLHAYMYVCFHVGMCECMYS